MPTLRDQLELVELHIQREETAKLEAEQVFKHRPDLRREHEVEAKLLDDELETWRAVRETLYKLSLN